jgi:hypothetical protein
VLVPGCRFLVALPVAVVTGMRSNAVRIEAICFFPQRETRLWTTTPDQVASVLTQIADGIEQGRFVQPDGAVYSGIRPG